MSLFDLFGNSAHSSPPLGDDSTYEDRSYAIQIAGTDEVIEEETPEPRHFYLLSVFLGVVIVLLIGQCFHLQITNGDAYRALAEGNSVRIITTQPDRGLIEDASGNTIAHNSRQLALALNPQALPAKLADRQALYKLLEDTAGVDPATLTFFEQNRRKNPELYPVKTTLSKDDSLLFEEKFANTPGVTIQEVPVREYASLPSIAHLLGYVGSVDEKDINNGLAFNQQVGKTGIEKVYNEALTGTPGQQRAEVNAKGQLISDLSDGKDSQPVTGQTLKLSIDSKLQDEVATALKDELARRTEKFGPLPNLGASAVILDPKDGSVKAMVSLPDYDPSLFAGGISSADYQKLLKDPGNPLLDRAIQGQYPPGSTIKPLVATAGLQEKVITADTTMVTPDAINIGGFRFPDWKVHGLTNTRKAIAESNDIFFYAVGGGWAEKNFQGLGIDRLDNYLRSFGLGSKTGIDLPGESSGLIADDSWKQANTKDKERWYIGDTYHSSIGQGFTLATPLQMAMATAAVANGGTVWEPQLAWSYLDPVTKKETLIPHKVLNPKVADPNYLQTVREGMRMAVESGSARPLNTLTVTSAGKTGTAQFGNQGMTHAWFTGFAPYDNPQIVYAIMIEGGGESFYSSVPVAEEILRAYFNDPLQPGQALSSSTGLSAEQEFVGEH